MSSTKLNFRYCRFGKSRKERFTRQIFPTRWWNIHELFYELCEAYILRRTRINHLRKWRSFRCEAFSKLRLKFVSGKTRTFQEWQWKVKENLIQVLPGLSRRLVAKLILISIRFWVESFRDHFERSFFASFRIEVDQRTVTLTFKQLCLSIYKSSNGIKPSKRKSCDVFISNVYGTWTLPRKLSNRKRFRHHHGACFVLLITQRFLWRKKRHLNLLPAWQ